MRLEINITIVYLSKMLLLVLVVAIAQGTPLFHFTIPRAAFKLPSPHQYTWAYRTNPALPPPVTLSHQYPIVFPSIVRGHTAPLYQGPKAAAQLRPATIIPTRILSQFRSQDELGGYHFSYSGGPSSRTETRSHDGTVRGGYSYVDPNGQLQSYQYIADEGGFRVTGGAAHPATVNPGQLRANVIEPEFVIHRTARRVQETNLTDSETYALR